MVVLGSSGDWDDHSLETLRRESDPLADQVVADHYASIDEAPSALFVRLARQQDPAPGPGPVAEYMASAPPVPAWYDADRGERAQLWMADKGSHIFCALYAGSLPTAYACADGAQVLGMTARLETDAKRRLNETGQFLLDIMRPGGMVQDGPGYFDVRRVRLMHAGVRWMILNRPGVDWDTDTFGLPVNQEDLLLTLLTFTQVVFDVFDRTGIKYSGEEAADYLHLWSYIGYLLGLREDLLPLDLVAAQGLMEHVRRTHFAASEVGKYLTAALLEQGRDAMPAGFNGLPQSAVRWYIGDDLADLVGVPRADWTRHLFGPLSWLSRRGGTADSRSPNLEKMSAWFGRSILELSIAAGRGGDRADFAIPDELAGVLGVGAASRPGRRGRRGGR